METKPDLNIIKPTTVAGGRFKDIRIFEETIISEPLICDELVVYDTLICQAPIQAKKLSIRGNAIFNQELTSLEITIDGYLEAHQLLKCNKLNIKNQLKALGKVEGYETIISGMAEFKDFDGFSLQVTGLIHCFETLRCNHISMLNPARGDLNEVMGANVSIEVSGDDPIIQVKINNLMAYHVSLNHTEVMYLEAKNVTLDDHSIIHRYREIGK